MSSYHEANGDGLAGLRASASSRRTGEPPANSTTHWICPQRTKWMVSNFLFFYLWWPLLLTAEPVGHLVIAGGALRDSNAEVFEAFVDRASLDGETRIGIVGAASARAVASANKFAEALARYGVAREDIEILPLAILDDASTPDVDESVWRRNGLDTALADRITKLTGIWFTGGDQQRIVDVLRKADRTATPVLNAIDQIYCDGAVIGGSSAGAAIQSEVMITGGSSDQALRYGLAEAYGGTEEQEEGRLTLTEGLAFFPHGIIDQHFDRKARLGRLVVALLENPEGYRIGYGIAENSALVYDAAELKGEVIGSGYVLRLDVTDSSVEETEGGRAVHNVRIDLLAQGDRFDFAGNRIAINAAKSSTREDPYWRVIETSKSGLLSPNTNDPADVIGFLLVDNATATPVEVLSWLGGDRGYLLRFSMDEKSAGHWAVLDGAMDSYSATGVRLDLIPVSIEIDP